MTWSNWQHLATFRSATLYDLSAAAFNGKLVVVATKTAGRGLTRGDFGLALADSRNDISDVPQGNFLFLAPRIAFDRQGALHLFWGETAPATQIAGAVGLLPVSTIWHSVHQPSGNWSQPQQVYASKRHLYWNADYAEVVTIDGVPHAIIADFDFPFALVHITMQGTKATVERVPTYVAAYTTITETTKSPGILVGYMAADTVRPAVGNSVFARRRTVSGWSDATRIQRSTDGGATSVHIRKAGSGVVHAIWAQSHSDGLAPDGWRTAYSRDDGQTWSAPHTTARAEDGLSSFRVQSYPSSCLRVFYLAGKSMMRPLMHHWMLADSSWQSGATLPLANGLTIVTAADDSALFVVELGPGPQDPTAGVLSFVVGRQP
ncbi:MAG: hypothetical protein WEE89_22690 [Gemmatimonadota bacterium]